MINIMIKNVIKSLTITSITFTFYFFINEFINNRYIKKNTQQITINDMNNIVKTGDIIYFKSHITTFGRLFGARLVGPFTHIGIVIKNPKHDKKYIIELTDRNTLTKLGKIRSGFHISNLETRIKTYDGHCYISTLHSSHIPNINNINRVLYKINKNVYKRKIHYPNNIHLYFLRLCLIKYTKYKPFSIKKIMCCSEFVKYILKELRVLDRKQSHLGILPSDFRYVKCNNVKCNLYKQIYHIKCN